MLHFKKGNCQIIAKLSFCPKTKRWFNLRREQDLSVCLILAHSFIAYNSNNIILPLGPGNMLLS